MLKKSRFFFGFAFIFILFIGTMAIYGLMGSLYRAELNSDDLQMAVNMYKAKLYNIERHEVIHSLIDDKVEEQIDSKIRKEFIVYENGALAGVSVDTEVLNSDNVTYSVVEADDFDQFLIDHFNFEEDITNAGSFYYHDEVSTKKIYYDYISNTRTFIVAVVDTSKFVDELRGYHTMNVTETEYPFYHLSSDLEIIYAEGESEIELIDYAKEKIITYGEKTIEKDNPLHYTIDSVILIIGSDQDFDGYYCIEVERPRITTSIYTHTIAILSYAMIILLGVLIFALKKGLI